jgi:hypothetical protein
MFVTLISLNLMTLFSPKTIEEPKISAKPEPCRITCTVTVYDTEGNSVSFTATAGGIFTSCETAGQRACDKAGEAAAAQLNFN